MGFFSKFEGKMEDTFEGAADKMFDAPISPVQIAKKAEKQMRREKMVGAGKQFAPTLYTVLVNPDDDRRLFGYYPTLAGETETYLTAKASEQGLVMDGQPLVRFIVDEGLKHGKFDVVAEAVAAPIITQLRQEEMQRYGLDTPQPRGYGAPTPQPSGYGAPARAQAPGVAPVRAQVPAPRQPRGGYPQQGYGQAAAPASAYGGYGAPTPQAGGYGAPARAQAPGVAPVRAQAPAPRQPRGGYPQQGYGQAATPVSAYGGYDQGYDDYAAPTSQQASYDDYPVYDVPAQEHQPLPYVPENELDYSIDYGEYTFNSRDFDERRDGAMPPLAAAPDTVVFAGGAQAATPVPTRAAVRARLIDTAANRAYDLAAVRLLIGRESKNDITVQDTNASRTHAELRLEPQGVWTITDLGSTNGTFVNGREIATQPLFEGDRITIGTTNFVFTQA